MKTEEANNEAQDAKATADGGKEDSGMSVAHGISVPPDSNIIGGGAAGEGADIGTASGPSDSGGG